MIRGIIFDLDGTLVDSGLDFEQMRGEMGLPAGMPILEGIKGLPESEAEKCRRILHEHEWAGYERGTLLPGASELLRAVGARNLPVGIVTRNSRDVSLSTLARPIVTDALGLPADAAQVFVMGFLRRDYGAAGLFVLARDGELSGVQAVVALTVMTLFVPCVANLLMIIKERGVRTGMFILGFVTIVAVGTGAALNALLHVLHITF